MLKFILNFTEIKVAHNLRWQNIQHSVVNFIQAISWHRMLSLVFAKFLSVANLWLQLMNEYSSNMDAADISCYLMSKMKVKHKRPMLELDLLFNNINDFFSDLKNSFK